MTLGRRNFLRLACGAVATPAVLPGASAQQAYPTRPVRLVVSVAAGGTNDVTARMIAQKLSEAWKQQVYVENVPGGGEIVGTGQVAKAAPDGYTALFATGAFTLRKARASADEANGLLARSAWCSASQRVHTCKRVASRAAPSTHSTTP